MAAKKKTGRRKSRPVKTGNDWERYPELPHLAGAQLASMQRRRRHRLVRYWLFRLQHSEEHGAPPDGPEHLSGFTDFWLDQLPSYRMVPTPGGGTKRAPVEPQQNVPVRLLGGYQQFGTLWDVNPDLEVYLRHSSIWHEWNSILYRVAPLMGER